MSELDLCVYMDCAGCARKIRKALEKIRGVDKVNVDLTTQRVTVTGYVDQRKILRAVQKAGMRAVLWPYQDSSEYGRQPTAPHLSHDHHPTTVASRYMHHHRTDPYYYVSNGYTAHVFDDHHHHNSDHYGYYYIDKGFHTMFSDDDPGSCAIM